MSQNTGILTKLYPSSLASSTIFVELPYKGEETSITLGFSTMTPVRATDASPVLIQLTFKHDIDFHPKDFRCSDPDSKALFDCKPVDSSGAGR